jgi:phenylalanyl-tRNA synthetase beta chain
MTTNNDCITLHVPIYRSDVRQPCDVAEDILRIYGYDKIDTPPQIRYALSTTDNLQDEQMMDAASNFLSSNGFNEIMTLSFTNPLYYNELQTFSASKLVMLQNPHNAQLNAMRQTLLFGGLESIAYNINRRETSMRFFEAGNVYAKISDSGSVCQRYSQQMHIALYITGLEHEKNWNNSAGMSNFFTLKNIVERFLTLFNIDICTMQTTGASADIFADGIAYKLIGQPFLELGIVSPKICMMLDIKQDVFFAQMRWDILMQHAQKQRITYAELLKYPAVRRDLSLLLDDTITFEQLRVTALKIGKPLIRRVLLFDVYQGGKLPAGKKSYALSFFLQDSAKTLNDSEIDTTMRRLAAAFEKEYGAALR